MSFETLPEAERIAIDDKNHVFDLVIIGSGPAGLSASICASRSKRSILLIEKALPGGSCTTACKIDNLIGYPKGILGDELAKNMEKQAFEHPITYTCETVEGRTTCTW